MPAIGLVTKLENGSYKGHLKTLNLRAEIDIVPNSDKAKAKQPDFRIFAKGFPIGAGWICTNASGKPYISLTFEAPELVPHKLYANLGRAAGQDDDDVFALIWNPPT